MSEFDTPCLVSPSSISGFLDLGLTSWYLHCSVVSCSRTPLSRTAGRSCHRVDWPGVGTGLLLGPPFPVPVPVPVPVPALGRPGGQSMG